MSPSRGPRFHQARLTSDRSWTCDCGESGIGEESRDAHQRAKATAAFARLDDGRAYALVRISTRTRMEGWAVKVLGNRYFRDPALRPYMQPFYDGFGALAAVLRWEQVAAAVTGGMFPDDDDLLRLQVALSLLGHFPINLVRLEQLVDPEARRMVRDAVRELLRGDT